MKKNAPDYCEVSIIHDGKKIMDGEDGIEPVSSCSQRPDVISNSANKSFNLPCFSGELKNTSINAYIFISFYEKHMIFCLIQSVGTW